MMTMLEMRGHLRDVTYRPGWAFAVHEDPWEGPYLRITAPVEDSYNPGETVALGIDSWLPPMPDGEAFTRWLAWRLGRIENHEMREWLKVHGKPAFDPHVRYGAEEEVN